MLHIRMVTQYGLAEAFAHESPDTVAGVLEGDSEWIRFNGVKVNEQGEETGPQLFGVRRVEVISYVVHDYIPPQTQAQV